MFNRAVHQPSPVPAKKQPSLSQTLFPSSSPLAKQDAYQAINVLKPSASSVMNGAGIAKTNGASNLLKVPASQAKGLKDALRTYGSLHDPYRYSTTVPSQDLPAGSGKVESLHEAVYFDENDFDDDADLDLEEGGLMQNRPTLAREENVLSGLPETPSPAKNYPASSAPLAWSSSPLQHKRTPPNASLLRRTNGTDVVDLTQPTTTVETDVDPNPRPSKRRTLPWLGNGDDAAAPEPHSCLPAHVQRIVDRNRAKKAEALQENGKFTPLPKNKQSFQHPWNKTASAMKEEQKKLRQANKKLVRNNDASDESLKLAISAKKRKKLESVFLSEEQQRVLKFVVEEGKSVFFTGSAGTLQ